MLGMLLLVDQNCHVVNVLKPTVCDTENIPFSTDTLRRFSEGSHTAIHGRPCGNARIVSAAMRRSSTQQCADRQRGNAQIISVAMRGCSADLYNVEEVRR